MCFANSLATRLSFVWYLRTARARSVARSAAEVKIKVWGVPGVTGDLISANLETVVLVLARESQDRRKGRTGFQVRREVPQRPRRGERRSIQKRRFYQEKQVQQQIPFRVRV